MSELLANGHDLPSFFLRPRGRVCGSCPDAAPSQDTGFVSGAEHVFPEAGKRQVRPTGERRTDRAVDSRTGTHGAGPPLLRRGEGVLLVKTE